MEQIKQSIVTNDNSSFVTYPFGNDGGNPFSRVNVNTIGLRGGQVVDAIILNGNEYGGHGGNDLGTITLGKDEYISEVVICTGDGVEFVRFTTNFNNAIAGGNCFGNQTVLSGIRVMCIGGRAGIMLDNLQITFIRDYKPSTIVEKNVGFILSYSAPYEKFYEYSDDSYKTLDSYEKTTQSMMSQTYSASVEGEYYAKVSASTEIQIEDSQLETVKRELESELKSGKSTEQIIPDGFVGISLVNGNLMQGADGSFWMYPCSVLSYSVIPTSASDKILDHYDLTGELYTQMDGLKKHRIIKNNYTYYNSDVIVVPPIPEPLKG